VFSPKMACGKRIECTANEIGPWTLFLGNPLLLLAVTKTHINKRYASTVVHLLINLFFLIIIITKTQSAFRMTSTNPVTYQIPVDQIDFSPNVSDQAENFFQTDADIARMEARQGMVNYDKGQAIKVSSKVLDMCLGRKIKSSVSSSNAQQDQGEDLDEREVVGSDSGTTTTYTTTTTKPAGAVTAGTGRTIVVDDKAVLGATMFLAESGHVARKINLEVMSSDVDNAIKMTPFSWIGALTAYWIIEPEIDRKDDAHLSWTYRTCHPCSCLSYPVWRRATRHWILGQNHQDLGYKHKGMSRYLERTH